MSKAIYDQLDGLLSPAIPPTPPDTLAKARASWKQLAFAIASGVVQHLQTKMDIQNIQAGGSITLGITQVNGAAATGTATGTVTLNQTGTVSGHVA